MRLSELRTGEKGVIVKVMGRGAFRKRIIEMGFIRGKEVDVIQNAPLKDPIHYRVMGYDVSLRRNDAQMIEVVSVAEFIEASTGKQENRPVDSYIQTSGKSLQAMAMHKGKTINVALVGNPNCGKTSLFNFASGAHEHVGNYSGVTVDAKAGTFHQNDYTFKIVDLPGTYSLSAYTPEELGLDKVKEKYSFMISSSGEKIDKKEYVKVAANVMKKNSEKNADGKETYSLTPVGEYYISFDGQDVLMKDLKSGEYKKLQLFRNIL